MLTKLRAPVQPFLDGRSGGLVEDDAVSRLKVALDRLTQPRTVAATLVQHRAWPAPWHDMRH